MPTLSDERFGSLRAQGFTGATSDMMLQWLQANGATSPAVPDAWEEMLAIQGFPYGHRNDSWYAFLESLGYSQGQLNDRELAFWQDGGVLSPDGVRITDQPDNWFGAEGATATFTVVATSGNASPLSYQWQEYATGIGFQDTTDAGTLSGSTTDTLTINPTVIADNGRRFRVRVTNSFNTINSQEASLNITGATFFIMTEAGDQIFAELALGLDKETVDERSP